MKTRNCYVTLGVPRDETAAGIEAAFRDLIRQSNQRFAEVTKAHDVLADPRERRRHDADLQQPEAPQPEPVSVFARPENIHPSFDEFYDRYVRNFTGRGVPKSEHMEGLTLEVVITPEEAMLGTDLAVGVPVFESCPACHGSGRDWMFPCLECGARGLIEKERTIDVHTPPMLRSGAILEYPLEQFGIENLYLRVHVSVG